jgi:hypothetical protein
VYLLVLGEVVRVIETVHPLTTIIKKLELFRRGVLPDLLLHFNTLVCLKEVVWKRRTLGTSLSTTLIARKTAKVGCSAQVAQILRYAGFRAHCKIAVCSIIRLVSWL